eukprot:256920-Rhodomonas_salina.2
MLAVDGPGPWGMSDIDSCWLLASCQRHRSRQRSERRRTPTEHSVVSYCSASAQCAHWSQRGCGNSERARTSALTSRWLAKPVFGRIENENS